MKAVWFEASGPASEVLIFGDRQRPVVAKGEVLVRLSASAVNPSDVKKRAGQQPAGLEQGFVIPHSDGAGVIEQVGQGVSTARVGERVWIYQAQYARHWGTAAEYISVPSAMAVALPDNVDYSIGACLGIPVMTAHRCVFADGRIAGKTVLVTGASGRVGYYAAQWAKWAGARVIATAGSAARCHIAQQSGADAVLDYRSENLAAQIMDASQGKGVDRVVDVEFGRNIQTHVAVLNVGGVIASYSSSQDPTPVIPFYAMMFKNITLRTVLVYNMTLEAKQQAMNDIFSALQKDQLTHRIDRVYPLGETAQAHEAVEKGNNNGCVVIQITPD